MKKKCLCLLVFFAVLKNGMAQIPVEIFATKDAATIDVMFFKFLEKEDHTSSPWLFFNRNRVTMDYRITDSTFLPRFASVNAVSYNSKHLHGFAPVLVGQFITWNARVKAGIQFAKVSSKITVFSWAVVETRRNPAIDYYLLFRYRPKINNKWKWFVQAESLNIIPTIEGGDLQFYQRGRFGLGARAWQFGIGVDLSQVGGQGNYSLTAHPGGFIRHEFN